MDRLRWLSLGAVAWICLAVAPPAVAVPIAFRADYLTLSGESCVRSFCAPIAPGATFAREFELDSAQLSVDGAYDVEASLDPPWLFISFNDGGSASLSVQAQVVGGDVVDLVIAFYESGTNTIPVLNISTYVSNSFDASGGTFTQSNFTSSSISYGSGSSAGTYAITRVPEPRSLVLLLVGIVATGRERSRTAA